MTFVNFKRSALPSNSDINPTNSKNPLQLSLCLLTWNEIEGCRLDVPKLPLSAYEEVFAVDGGSTDGTVEYLESMGITVYRQPVRGYNQAYLFAFSKCTKDALVLYHPKGTIDQNDILKFRTLFEEGNDLVIGSRNIRGAQNEEDENWIRPRKWFVLVISFITSLLWRRTGPIIWDVLHGFRGMRKDRFIAIEPLTEGLSIDIEMVARSYRKGFRAVEFPTHESKRIGGETHFKAFRTGRLLLKYMMLEMRRSA